MHINKVIFITSLSMVSLIHTMEQMNAKRIRFDSQNAPSLATLCIQKLIRSDHLSRALSQAPLEIVEKIVSQVPHNKVETEQKFYGSCADFDIPQPSKKLPFTDQKLLRAVQAAASTAPVDIACYLLTEFPFLSGDTLLARLFELIRKRQSLSSSALQCLSQLFRPLDLLDKSFGELIPQEIYDHPQATEFFSLLLERHALECALQPFVLTKSSIVQTDCMQTSVSSITLFNDQSPETFPGVGFASNSNGDTLVSCDPCVGFYVCKIEPNQKSVTDNVKSRKVLIIPTECCRARSSADISGAAFSPDQTLLTTYHESHSTLFQKPHYATYLIPIKYLKGTISYKQLIFIMVLHHLLKARPWSCNYYFLNSRILMATCQLMASNILATFDKSDALFFDKQLLRILEPARKERAMVFRKSPDITEKEKIAFDTYFFEHELPYLEEDLSRILSKSFKKQLYNAIVKYLQEKTFKETIYKEYICPTSLTEQTITKEMHTFFTFVIANQVPLTAIKNDMFAILKQVRK